MRAKLFRYDHCADPKEWKERGTGNLNLNKHNNPIYHALNDRKYLPGNQVIN